MPSLIKTRHFFLHKKQNHHTIKIVRNRIQGVAMMRKKVRTLSILSLIAMVSFSMTSYAGTWKQDTGGWHWQQKNGGYARGCWKNINSKWYYFHSSSYMAKSEWINNYYVGPDGAMYTQSLTPDGYMVDAQGKWIQGYYCKNLTERYNPSMAWCNIKDIKSISDGYEAVVEVVGGVDNTNTANPYKTIIRIRKDAIVHWQGEKEKTMSMEGYVHQQKKTTKILRFDNATMDKRGYVHTFFDGMYD